MPYFIAHWKTEDEDERVSEKDFVLKSDTLLEAVKQVDPKFKAVIVNGE